MIKIGPCLGTVSNKIPFLEHAPLKDSVPNFLKGYVISDSLLKRMLPG